MSVPEPFRASARYNILRYSMTATFMLSDLDDYLSRQFCNGRGPELQRHHLARPIRASARLIIISRRNQRIRRLGNCFFEKWSHSLLVFAHWLHSTRGCGLNDRGAPQRIVMVKQGWPRRLNGGCQCNTGH